MPESVEAYYQRIADACDEFGVLRARSVDDIVGWEIFPFEPDSLRLKPIQAPDPREEPRRGEDPRDCRCASPADPAADPDVLWSNPRWLLREGGEHGLPFMAVLMPVAHHDLTDLPDDLAGELGLLLARLADAVESLPSVGRCHVNKWGDGGAHLHVFVMGRPARLGQLRGSCLPLWEDWLPRVPADVLRDNAAFVVERLIARVGGRAGRLLTG